MTTHEYALLGEIIVYFCAILGAATILAILVEWIIRRAS